MRQYTPVQSTCSIGSVREPRVQRGQRLDRRAVHVAVEADDRELAIGYCRKRVLEPAFEEPDAVVQQAVLLELLADVVDADVELLVPDELAVKRVGLEIDVRSTHSCRLFSRARPISVAAYGGLSTSGLRPSS